MENKFLKVFEKLKEIENFCANSDATYDDVLEHVEDKLKELKQFASENDVPLVVSAEEIMNTYYGEDSYEEDSSYYEEESSYYEE